MPPKGEAPVQGPWTAEAEEQAFDALMSKLTGKPAAAAEDEPVTQREPKRAGRARRQPSGLPSGAAATPTRRR